MTQAFCKCCRKDIEVVCLSLKAFSPWSVSPFLSLNYPANSINTPVFRLRRPGNIYRVRAGTFISLLYTTVIVRRNICSPWTSAMMSNTFTIYRRPFSACRRCYQSPATGYLSFPRKRLPGTTSFPPFGLPHPFGHKQRILSPFFCKQAADCCLRMCRNLFLPAPLASQHF